MCVSLNRSINVIIYLGFFSSYLHQTLPTTLFPKFQFLIALDFQIQEVNQILLSFHYIYSQFLRSLRIRNMSVTYAQIFPPNITLQRSLILKTCTKEFL